MKTRLLALAAVVAAPLMIAGCDNAGTPSAPGGGATANVAAPAGQNWTEVVSQTPEGGFIVGNPDAPVKLLEYGARSCPACGAFARASNEALFKTYIPSGKVSFEFRDFLVHGASDLAAALVGQCAGPGPFFTILEQGYADQNAWLDRLQNLSPADQQAMSAGTPAQGVTLLAEKTGLIDFVGQRGIPAQQARACLSDQKKIEALAAQTEKAAKDGTVAGTPTLIINGEKVNSNAWPDVEAALKAAGA